MNEEILICFLTITSFLIIRLKSYGIIAFLQTLLSNFVLISIGTFIFLIYDTWLGHKISKNQIQNILDKTYEDINDITSLYKTIDTDSYNFPKDSTDDKRNKKLIRESLIIGLIPTFGIFLLLYKLDKDFYTSFYKILSSIVVIYIIDLYFSWSILSDFNGEGLDVLRGFIVKSLEDRDYVIPN